MKHHLKTTVALLVLALIAPSTAQAGQTIEFTHEGTSQGFTLDGQAFPGPWNFTITAFGDIGERVPFGNGWSIDHTAAMIEIEGFGNFAITSLTRTFVNNVTGLVGFSRGTTNGSDLLSGPAHPDFSDWDNVDRPDLRE